MEGSIHSSIRCDRSSSADHGYQSIEVASSHMLLKRKAKWTVHNLRISQAKGPS